MFLIPNDVVVVVAVAAVFVAAAIAIVDVLFVFEVFPDLFTDDNVEEDNILALLWSLFLGDPGMVVARLVVVVVLLVNIIDDVSNVGVIQDVAIAAFDVEVVVVAVIVLIIVAFVIVPLNGSIVVSAAAAAAIAVVFVVVVVLAVAFLSLFLITADLTRIFEIDISLNNCSYDFPKNEGSLLLLIFLFRFLFFFFTKYWLLIVLFGFFLYGFIIFLLPFHFIVSSFIPFDGICNALLLLLHYSVNIFISFIRVLFIFSCCFFS